jgi:hypothetical protein
MRAGSTSTSHSTALHVAQIILFPYAAHPKNKLKQRIQIPAGQFSVCIDG